jgi:hypothetical protein
MKNLVLHLKSCYFREVASGAKQIEYRLANAYWNKQIVGQQYDRVVIWNAFKPYNSETVIVFPWRGYERTVITHEHFGPDPVEVFAIKLER